MYYVTYVSYKGIRLQAKTSRITTKPYIVAFILRKQLCIIKMYLMIFNQEYY